MEAFRGCIRVSGTLAMFADEKTGSDPVSYPVMTPSAARGILERNYWKPGVIYRILRIGVERPIRYVDISTNEFQNIRRSYNVTNMKNRTTRRKKYLSDVSYLIVFEMMVDIDGPDRDLKKHWGIARKSATEGNLRDKGWPCLGTSECVTTLVEWVTRKEEYNHTGETIDLGIMFHSFDYSKEPREPRFFHAVINNGWVDCTVFIVYSEEVA